MRLVYVSPVPLSSYAQRPHHLVEWFHRRFGATVIWIEPGPSRLPKLGDWRRLLRRNTPLGPCWADDDWIERLSFRTLPLEPLAWGRAINRYRWQQSLRTLDGFMTADSLLVVGKPCALALELAQRYPEQTLVFDAMDSMAAFYHGLSARWMQRAEHELAERADRILTASTALHEKYACYGEKVCKVMNGLSTPTQLFSAAPPLRPKPEVIGYVGAIASWFDWQGVIRLAVAQPQAEIRLFGPCEQRPPSALPPNVRLLGPIAHEAVYAEMREFSAGIIPFRINALTDFVDPVKYYEYRAMGLPVLSTRFGEMKYRTEQDGVFFLEDLYCMTPTRNDWRKHASPEQTAAFCEQFSWDRRFDAIASFIRPA